MVKVNNVVHKPIIKHFRVAELKATDDAHKAISTSKYSKSM